MSIHRAFSRHLFTLDGNVASTGGSLNLAKGQFAIVDKNNPTANGAKVVSNFAGLSDKTSYEIRVGKSPIANTRTSQNSKAYASHPFKISDVRDIYVSAPKSAEQKFDKVLIGYDGINDNTKLTFEEGVSTVLDVILKGKQIGFFTDNNEFRVKIHFGKEIGETDQQVVERVVARLKEETFQSGIKLTEAIDIKIVDSSTLSLSGIPYVISELSIKDDGSSNAFADIQAQYPLYKLQETRRTGINSVYSIVHPQSASLADYTQSLPSLIKGCVACPAGYTELEAGFVYSINIEDDGVDVTTTIDDVPGFVTGTVVRIGSNNGVGTYTVVVDNELTDEEIAAYVATAGIKTTATFTALGDVKAVCENATLTSTAWVDAKTGFASVESYKIQLRDDNCDGSRLAELQKAYPQLVIEEGAASGSASRALTLTGTSGTANINVAGVNYLATFATDLATTASNFVLANAAAILAATGAVVTSVGAVISFADNAEGFPAISIVNASGNLSGTLAAIDYAVVATVGGCQRVYSTTVITDLVFDECSDIFLQKFTSVAPEDFDFISWEKLESAPNATAKMGIILEGKPFILSPEEYLYDEMPFYETSTEIKVAGGYVEEVNFSFEPVYRDIFSVKVLSRKEDRDHLGAELKHLEDMSRTYFDGNVKHRGNNVAKALLGEESLLENLKQYVNYTIVIGDNKYSQGLGRTSDTAVSYVIHAEVGKHQALEDIVNKLAVKAELEAVQAFARI